MAKRLPEGRIISVQIDVALPVAATREQVLEWMTMELCKGIMRTGNPLAHFDVEAIHEPTLTDTERSARPSPPTGEDG